MTDIPGNQTTTATVSVGGTAIGGLEVAGDHDWFAVTLTADQAVTITINGVTLGDPYLYVRDSGGFLLFENDDISSGVNRDSRIAFNPGYSGTYYIDVGAFDDDGTGEYQVSVDLYELPPVATVDQIADQLVSGFWEGDFHRFDVTQGGTITVNIATLSATEKTMARAALAAWSDIIGVVFQEVTGEAEITFSNDEEVGGPFAATFPVWADGIISSADIQISSSWVQSFGSALNSYGFETYVHEIGHALGLGHAGNYNFDARYPYDALFRNDATPLSVMSYFDQRQNTYFNSSSDGFDVTPMGADILAMQMLYGLSTTTRTGDTTYGYNSTAGERYNAGLYTNVAYTIFDNGGRDTLDFSGTASEQTINLNAETFSDVTGRANNLYIARGVVVENAIGGAGSDTIIQSAVDNVLSGGPGRDVISYATASAAVVVNLSFTAQQDTVGAGRDTLNNFEELIGSGFSDTLTGSAFSSVIRGGNGDDTIINLDPGRSNQSFYGDAGNDRFVSGPGSNNFFGGDGFDTVDYSSALKGVIASIGQYTSGFDYIERDVERVVGSAFNDTLSGFFLASEVFGGAGDDVLSGQKLYGGTGNDTYNVGYGSEVFENAGEGIDLARSQISFTLSPNIENLILTGSEANSGAGNSLANQITGNVAANLLAGNDGADTLAGGGGDDVFLGTIADMNGDTITDFNAGDTIVFTDARIGTFSYALSAGVLTYAGGAISLANVPPGTLVARAASPSVGVMLTLLPANTQNDSNGDHRSDFIVRDSQSGWLTDYLGAANGSVAGNSANVSIQLPLDWKVVGTGDYNGDGRDDMLLRSDAGWLTDWLGTATGGFTNNGANTSLFFAQEWKVVGTADINGDGKADMILRRDDGWLTDWIGNANGSFFNNGETCTLYFSPDWKVVSTGDFNGDGYSDLLLRRDDGWVTNWLGTAGGAFTNNGANTALFFTTDWKIIGTGDVNGDGKDDLILRRDDGWITDWLGTSAGSFTNNGTNTALFLTTDWKISSIADFNGDGREDLLLRNDSGWMTNWLGTATGSFASNGANFSTFIAPNWVVQDPFM